MVAVAIPDLEPTDEERALAARLLEANRAQNRLIAERDKLQERVEQLEDALALARTRAAVAAGGWRHEIRCDTRACAGRIAITTDVPPDAVAQVDIGRGLVALAIATGWGVGSDTALALRSQPTGGEDKCPACMRALVAASRTRAAATVG